MGLLSDFLQRNEIDAEAKRLAEQFVKRLPQHRTADARKVASEIELTLGHARGFQRKARLGVYGKSRLANTFQWTLIDSGYEKTLASEIGREIASRISAEPEKSRRTQ